MIGGHYPDISHGDALASIYREIMVFNAGSMPEREAFIAGALVPGGTDQVAAFEQFFGKFRFANKLKQKRVQDPQLIKTIARDTFTYMKFYAELNPAAINAADVELILARALA